MIINWKPDKKSSKPIYKQITAYIKNKISCGEWTVGYKLPTQRELAELFEVNRSTVVEALDELKADGLIESRGSKGTVIVNNTWSLLAASPPPNWQDYIESGIHKPNLATIQVINKLEFQPEITRLGTGELSPELFPKEIFKKLLSSVGNKINSLGYEEPKGSLLLRRLLSEYVKKYGLDVSPSCILIVSGALQALQLISLGVLHPGSTVFIEKSSYLRSLHIFQSAGMILKGFEMDSYGIKPEEIKKNRGNKSTTLLYTIPTFHNPTGITMPDERRKQILNICEEERLPIIEDDVYRELWIDKEPPRPIKVMDKNGIVLYMGSTSKSLAPGLRIGWLIGPEPVIERLGDIKMQTDYGSSSLSQWIFAEWISSGLYGEYLATIRKELMLRRQIVLNSLERWFSDIATWKKPSGGFYIWLRLNRRISMNKLFSMALKEKILLNPGNVYEYSNEHNIRISYAYASLTKLEEGLEKLSYLVRDCIKENT